MTQATMNCPHCGAANAYASQFCQNCGKALPSVMPTGPRVVGSEGFATTAAGQQLQAEQLHKQARRARGALMAVAIIATVFAAILFFLIPAVQRNAPSNNPQMQSFNQGMTIGVGIVAVVFWGLYFWARSQPLPAAIVGLVLYGTLIVINIVTTISASAQGGQVRGSPVGCVDIIIVAVLAQAITAGVQHRKLLKQQQAMGTYGM
jgi:hypothetical protein